MFAPPQAGLLPDGRRFHLNQGPIDLVIEAFGEDDEILAAYRRAEFCFRDILRTLVAELPQLRQPVTEPAWQPVGPVAQRMMLACWPHRDRFLGEGSAKTRDWVVESRALHVYILNY